MKLTLIRTEESVVGTNGELTIDESPCVVYKTIEKPWRGNLPHVSRIPPSLKYKISRVSSSKHGQDVLCVLNVEGRGEEQLPDQSKDEVIICPARDAASLQGGSIGIVEKHTGVGTGFAPDKPFKAFIEDVSRALARGEAVILEIRA